MRNKAALITESSKEIGLARSGTSAKYGAIASLAYINKPDAQIPATKDNNDNDQSNHKYDNSRSN